MRLTLFLAGCLVCAGSVSGAESSTGFPFQVGERLTYQVYWGPFVAGRASLEVQGIESVNGHDCYHLCAQATTTGLADLLFHVRSTTESWLDVDRLFTRRYREDRVEGKSTRHTESVYDYDQKQQTMTDLHSGEVKTLPLTRPVQDVVSSVYFLRTQPMQLNLDRDFLMNVGDTNYVVNVRPDQRRTVWVRPLGDTPALRIEPKPTLRIVAANKGRMWFWVSDDARRLPLLVASDLRIGSAKLVLDKVEPTSVTQVRSARFTAGPAPATVGVFAAAP
jgi:hypothetical protein